MIWRVVKRILFGLLALVALPFVLLVIIFLAIPVRYKVDANTGVGGQSTAYVRITYLFGLVRMTYKYINNDGLVKIRIFGIPVGRKKKQLPEAERKSFFNKIAEENKPDKTKKPDKSKTPIKKRLTGIKDNISAVLTYPNRKAVIDLFKKMLKRQWKIIKPKKLNISGQVGFADPAQTGFLFAAYGVVAEFLNIRKYIQLSGNFDTPHTVVLLDIYVKGSINAARMMFAVLNFIRKKPIRKLIKDIINLREDD